MGFIFLQRKVFFYLFLAVSLGIYFGGLGCKSGLSPADAIDCLVDGDCPPSCNCQGADILAAILGTCESPDGACGGSCTVKSGCPAGQSCSLDQVSSTGTELYSCSCKDQTPGDGSDGAACRVNGDCDSMNCDNSCTCVGGGPTGGCPAAGSGDMTGACDDPCDANDDCASGFCCLPGDSCFTDQGDQCTCRMCNP